MKLKKKKKVKMAVLYARVKPENVRKMKKKAKKAKLSLSKFMDKFLDRYP